jgi:predicted MPP superfamily phosphohydrolase
MLVIGDIHGSKFWKNIVNQHLDEDYIVFVGDYVDSHNAMSNTKMLKNLLDIIKFKEKYPDKVKLLLGNHDIHYYFLNSSYRGSGFNFDMMFEFNTIFKNKKHLFQVAFMYNNTIVSHAGITNRLYQSVESDYKDALDLGWGDGNEHNTIADKFNFLFNINSKYLFYIGDERGGLDPFSGIFWAGMKELCEDYLVGYNQVIGHTHLAEKTIKNYDDITLTFIDTGNENAYHLVTK